MSAPRGASAGPTLQWLLRAVRHRTWAQGRLLAVAAAVAVLVSVLVSSLAVVVATAERYGVAGTLEAERDRAQISITLASLDADVPTTVAALDDALAELLRAPAELDVQVTSVMYDVRRPGQLPGYVYLDRRDGIEENALLVSGEWPQPWSGDRDDPVPVAIPAVGAQTLGMELGGTTTLRNGGREDVVVRVVGTYEIPVSTSEHWERDRLGGRGFEPNFPVPYSGGFQRTQALGPLVVAPESADAGAFAVRRMVIRAQPDLSWVEARDLPGLRRTAADVDGEIGYLLDDVVGEVSAGGALPGLLGEAASGVVVARAGSAVATALLLVLAAAALLQTARLVAEARSAEHDLMLARGASRRHLVAMVALESLPIGALAALVGPLVAPSVARALSASLAPGIPAGLDGIRSLPAGAWAGGLAVGGLVVAMMLVPLLRAPATFVEGQQHRGRADRRASIGRLVGDLALVVLAGIAVAQLRAYGGPLAGGGSDMAVDPVLAVGPALLLVAGAALGIRVLPLAARGIERAAASGRGLVLPLAGWDIGRRPQNAATAVLLLAVAVASATFGLVQGATWETSQRDQTAFAVGAPVVVEDGGRPSADALALQAEGAMPQPVGRLDGRVTLGGGGAVVVEDSRSTGERVEVLAATGPARATLDRGRVGREGGTEVAALPATEASDAGIDLGTDLLGLSIDVAVSGGSLQQGPAVALRAVLEDATGVMSTVELGTFMLDEEETTTTQVLLPDVRTPAAETPQAAADALRTQAAERAYPVRLVAVEALTVMLAMPDGPLAMSYDAQVTLQNVSALRPADDVTAVAEADWAIGSRVDGGRLGVVVDPVEVPTTGWRPIGTGLGIRRLDPGRDPMWLRVGGSMEALYLNPSSGALITWEPVEAVPTVISAEVAERLGADDATFRLDVDGVSVPAAVADVVEQVPTVEDPSAVAADHRTLARALVQAGAPVQMVQEWWVDPPDVDAYVAALPTDADGRPRAERTTTLVGATQAALDDPLRAATPVTLLLLALGGALVAAVGFAVHTAVSVRGRALELAQLRAVGLARSRLTLVLGLEATALAGLGVVLGIAVGRTVGSLVGRLLVVGPNGAAPVPSTVLVVPADVAWVAAALLVVVAVLTLGLAAAQRAADPAALLRAGESR